MLSKRIMWIVWPAFLVACVLEMLVFALVDPQDLHWFGQPLLLSRQSVYTVSFFVFWVIAMVGGGLTALLSMTPQEINREASSDGDVSQSGASPGSVNQ
jgi:hypothetical protein